MDGTEVLLSLSDILLLLLFSQTTRRPSGKRKQAATSLANPTSKKEKRKRLNGRPHVSLSVFLPLFSEMRRTSRPGRLASPFCRPIRKFVKKRMSSCLFFPFFSPPFMNGPPPAAAAAARRTSQSLRVQSMKWRHPRRTSKSPWQFWKRADSRKWLSQGRQRPIALDGCDTLGHFLRLPESEQRKGLRCQAAPFSRCSLCVIILRFAPALRIFPGRGRKLVELYVLYVKMFLICSCF